MNATLKYELEKLESIISNNLPGAREKNVHFTAEQSEVIKETFREEVERIKKKFVHEIFAFEDERHLERYIQFHQQELIRITDELSNRNREFRPGVESENLDYSELTQYAYNSTEELLGFIERHFTKYFDQDTKAPESYIVLAGSEVVKSFGALQDQLKKLDTDSYRCRPIKLHLIPQTVR